MKTTSKRKTKSKEPKAELTQEAFIASLQGDGANNPTLEKFLAVMKVLTMSYTQFSVYDCFYLSKGFQLDTQEVKELFTRWTERETQLGNLQRLESCYDFELYRVINNRSFVAPSVI